MTQLVQGNPFEALAQRLALPLDPELIRQRQGPGGKKLSYLSGADVIRALNDALAPVGPLGWSRRIDELRSQVDEAINHKTGEVRGWNALATALVTIELHPGGVTITRHQDVGHGIASNAKTREDALELAEKSAVTDAVKRAARALGPRLGLALYDGADERGELGADDSLGVDLASVPDQRKAPDCKTGEALAADLAGKRAPLQDEPRVDSARWLLEQRLDPIVSEALRNGVVPGAEGDLLRGRLPAEPKRAELEVLRPLSGDAVKDLVGWPARDPLTRPLLVEVHEAALDAVGEEDVTRLWGELGVELRRGVEVSGYQARLFVAAAGAVAQGRLAGERK